MCSIPGCKSVTGFLFPKDQEIRLKWRKAIHHQGISKAHHQLWSPTSISRVCAKHFTPDDFRTPIVSLVNLRGYGGNGRKMLKPEAVPSVFNFENTQTVSVVNENDKNKVVDENQLDVTIDVNNDMQWIDEYLDVAAEVTVLDQDTNISDSNNHENVKSIELDTVASGTMSDDQGVQHDQGSVKVYMSSITLDGYFSSVAPLPYV
mgnify:CR=1 FL=1